MLLNKLGNPYSAVRSILSPSHLYVGRVRRYCCTLMLTMVLIQDWYFRILIVITQYHLSLNLQQEHKFCDYIS